MQIQLVKLTTGDEIIGEIETQDDCVVLTNPVKLGMDPSTGQISLVPYPLACGQNVILYIKLNHIIFKIDVDENCSSGYKQSFGHIVEPPKGLII